MAEKRGGKRQEKAYPAQAHTNVRMGTREGVNQEGKTEKLGFSALSSGAQSEKHIR